MIKYNLKCEKDHNFDAWFSDSSNFDKQNKKNFIACPQCNSTKIEKNIMAPNIGAKKQNYTNALKTKKNVEKILKNVQKHIEKNFEYVGDKFADEARSIHYGEKEEREIYGETTLEEAVDLIEEGVNVSPIPGVSRKLKN